MRGRAAAEKGRVPWCNTDVCIWIQAKLDELEGGAAEELAVLESKHQAQIDELEKTSAGVCVFSVHCGSLSH